MNGKNNSNEPAWKHTVRTALNDLKRKKLGLYPRNQEDSSLRGYWIIGDSISFHQNQIKPNPVKLESEQNLFPDQVIEFADLYEGSIYQVKVNAYERSTKARQQCIAYYGINCSVCNFDFNQVYGELGQDFIHVHHVVPLSEIGKEYKVDPIKDLCPVCPNCHAMIHRRSPPYSIEDMKNILNTVLYGNT